MRGTMMRGLLGLAVATLLISAFGTPAAAITGNDLKLDCEQPDMTAPALYCLAYMTGVLDAIRGLDSVEPLHRLCEPDGVTGDQLLAMTRKYFVDHPDRLHYLASSLIEDMYAEAFGCKKTS